ncbi:MAG: orotate phosphoribosyltransferase [Bdellovibrionaceae bacterium]|nr:orotate phosphoribosyltransferase [Pseudobdellovibrionaceae bacterium]
MDKKTLAKKIYEVAHLTGEFKLRSGQTSHEYFDKYRFEARPELLSEIAQHMKGLIPAGTQALAALEMGGIPIATALSLITGIPCVFVRKEAKAYGTCKFAEGLEIKGLKLCIIEDVITTGGQVLLSTADLRSMDATITDVLCVIDRGGGEEKLKTAGLKMHALFNMADLKAQL